MWSSKRFAGKLNVKPKIFCPCLLLFVLLGLVCPHGACAEDPKWFLTFYAGQYSPSDLKDILTGSARFDDSELICLALSRQVLSFWKDRVTGELEGQVAKHFGIQDHFETNGLFLLRWHPFPWDRYLDTSFAVGDGLSYAWGRPEAEVIESDSSTRLLNYLVFELCFDPHWSCPNPPFSFVFRIHHRSGVFGLFNGTHGGSNFLCFGIRYGF